MSVTIPTLMEIEVEKYWSQYHWAKPFAEEDGQRAALIGPDKEYKQYFPADPMHPRAWIPPYVRWAKRKQVNFTCPITGWKETDWFRGMGGGPYRKVGTLTMDHIIPGAKGGLSVDENIRAISEIANAIKGSKDITDDQLRERIHGSFKVVFMPEDLLAMLNKYVVTSYKVGP